MEKCWEALWRKSAGEACHFVAGKPAGPLAGPLRGCLLFAWLKFGKLVIVISDVSVGCVTSIAALLLLGHRWCAKTKRGRFKSACGFVSCSGFEVLRTREKLPVCTCFGNLILANCRGSTPIIKIHEQTF